MLILPELGLEIVQKRNAGGYEVSGCHETRWGLDTELQ